jgi:nitronate monooxygenase
MDLVRDALEEGADALLVQGHEAGGHTGTMGLLPFLSSALEVTGDTPVLTAGGVSSGRALAAVLAAGADGASLGTAFLASREATDVPDAYKECIVQSDGEDTVFTTLYDEVRGLHWPEPVAMRLRRTKHTDQWLGREDEVEDHLDELRAELPTVLDFERFDPEVTTVLYGQSAASVNAVHPAAEIVRSVCDEAAALLRNRVPALLDDPA